MDRHDDILTVKRLAAQTLESATSRPVTYADGKVAHHSRVADYCGNCLTPKGIDLIGRTPRIALTQESGRPTIEPHQYDGSKLPHFRLQARVRCRKCNNCLESKRTHWSIRASTEYRKAQSTVAYVLTYRPQIHVLHYYKMISDLRKRGVDYAKLTTPEKWYEKSRFYNRDLTLTLKRLRFSYPEHPFRYLATIEPHQSGHPHWHLMMHYPTEFELSREQIADKWGLGFVLPPERPRHTGSAFARYMTKYIQKHYQVRIRASEGYGKAENV